MRIIKLLVITLSILSALYFLILSMVLMSQEANDISHIKSINNHPVKCVNNVSYLVGCGRTLTLKVDINNKPISCDF